MKTKISFFFILNFFTLPIFSQWSITYLSETRNALSATSSEERAYFAGGLINWSAYSTVVDIYEKEESAWSTAQLSAGRGWMAAANGNGKVFFAGGEDVFAPSGDQTSNVVDIYDEITGQWTTENLSEGRVFLTAVRVGEKILFAGGIKKLNWSTSQFELSNRVDIYDLNTGQWSSATLSQPRAFIASAVNGKLAFFAGGWVGPSTVSDVVDIYDSETDTWSTASLSVPRAQAAGASVGDKVLFAGGGLNTSFTPTDIVDIYDTEMNEWSTATLSVPRGELLAATIDDKVFFVGGSTINQTTLSNGFDYFNEIDIYNNTTEQWTTDELQNSRVNHAVTALDNKLFVAGGNNLNNIFGDIEILDLSLVNNSNNTKSGFKWVVHPNPPTDILRVSIQGMENARPSEGKVLLHNSTGHLVKEFIFSGSSFELSLPGLSKGLYFVTLLVEETASVKKITVF